MVIMNLLLMVFMNLNIRNDYYISFVNNKPVIYIMLCSSARSVLLCQILHKYSEFKSVETL